MSTGDRARDPPPPDAATAETEDFVARWSRRKHQCAETVEAAPEPAPVQDEAPVLEDADMPPLESLDQDADYSGFLSPGVSENLRRQALRQLFRSPKFNITDGMDDYAGDYSKWEPLGDVITADMRHALERAAKRLLEERGTDPAQAGGDETMTGEEADPPPRTQPTETQDDPGN